MKIDSTEQPTVKLLRKKELLGMLKMSKSWLHAKINPASPHYDAQFPRPIKMGDFQNSAVAWLESEVVEWMYQQRKKH